jgi:hypothetical protein
MSGGTVADDERQLRDRVLRGENPREARIRPPAPVTRRG